jgi:hypothetical protein
MSAQISEEVWGAPGEQAGVDQPIPLSPLQNFAKDEMMYDDKITEETLDIHPIPLSCPCLSGGPASREVSSVHPDSCATEQVDDMRELKFPKRLQLRLQMEVDEYQAMDEGPRPLMFQSPRPMNKPSTPRCCSQVKLPLRADIMEVTNGCI